MIQRAILTVTFLALACGALLIGPNARAHSPEAGAPQPPAGAAVWTVDPLPGGRTS